MFRRYVTQRLRSANDRLVPTIPLLGPEWVILGVNSFCNLHCKMCDVGTGNGETNFGANLTGAANKSMPWDLFSHILGEVKRDFPSAKLGFAFTEPMAWPDLPRAVRAATTSGIYSSITTNGLLLPQRAQELLDVGCQDVFVSLDGPPTIHNHIRGHTASYERAYQGMQILLRSGSKTRVSVYGTITPWNIGHLTEFVSGLSDLPLSHVGLMHNNFVDAEQVLRHNRQYQHTYPATASNTFECDVQHMNLQELSEDLMRLRSTRHPFPVTITPDIYRLDDLQTYYQAPNILMAKRCKDVSRMIMIDPDGIARPTHGRCYRFDAGNIRTQNLKEIWRADPLRRLREQLHTAGGFLPACSRCCSAVSTNA